MKTKLLILLSLIIAVSAYAGSATWNLNPTNNSWTTAGNWTPATVPNGASDVASFGATNTHGLACRSHLQPAHPHARQRGLQRGRG